MSKNVQILIRVSKEDKESIKAEAEALGLSVGSYLLFLHKTNVREV